MLQRALGQILPFGYLLQPGAALDERARYAPRAQLHGKRDADRPATYYDNLMPSFFTHGTIVIGWRKSQHRPIA
jgi:hypothetical protein